MLRKSKRLGRSQFSLYYTSGKRFHGTYLTLISSPQDVFRCSVVVSKKVAKQAVERNRIKRRLYAMMAKMRDELKLQGIFIVLAKPALTKLTRAEFIPAIKTELGRGLNNR